MRLAVRLDRRSGALTLRTDRLASTMTPAQIAAAVARAVENALATPPRTRTAKHKVRTEQPPVDASGVAGADGALVEIPAQLTTDQHEQPVDQHRTDELTVAELPVAELRMDEPPADDTEGAELRGAARSGAVDVVVAADARRREALRLLDAGVSDETVCVLLGISAGQLRRWDADAHEPVLAGSLGQRRAGS